MYYSYYGNWARKEDHEKFIRLALEYASRRSSIGQNVRYIAYTGSDVPHYAYLTSKQLEWYFYWRDKIRHGTYLKTSPSYIFIYACELIYLIGVKDANTAFKILTSLWQNYRQPENIYLLDYERARLNDATYNYYSWDNLIHLNNPVDRVLVDWIADFIILHQLPVHVLDWYWQVLMEGASPTELDLAIASALHGNPSFDRFPEGILYAIATYYPPGNKFYQGYNTNDYVVNGYRQAIQAVDALLKQKSKTDKGLFDQYRSKKIKTFRRPLFRGAWHTYGNESIDILKGYSWKRSRKLPVLLKEIIRYSENILRTRENFRTKLRNIDLPDEWKLAIKQALFIAPPQREIIIDMNTVADLHKESLEIRGRLINNDDVDEPDNLSSKVIEHSTNSGKTLNSLVETSWFDHLPNIWVEFISLLQISHWQLLERIANKTSTDITHISNNQLLDEINEFALATIGDIILSQIDFNTIKFEPEYETTLIEIVEIAKHRGGKF